MLFVACSGETTLGKPEALQAQKNNKETIDVILLHMGDFVSFEGRKVEVENIINVVEGRYETGSTRVFIILMERKYYKSAKSLSDEFMRAGFMDSGVVLSNIDEEQ